MFLLTHLTNKSLLDVYKSGNVQRSENNQK